MEVALIVIRRRALRFRIADDDVRDRAVIRDKTPLLLCACDHRVEVDIRFVALIVFSLSADPDLHEINSRRHGNVVRVQQVIADHILPSLVRPCAWPANRRASKSAYSARPTWLAPWAVAPTPASPVVGRVTPRKLPKLPKFRR